jgi:hypothetical protein
MAVVGTSVTIVGEALIKIIAVCALAVAALAGPAGSASATSSSDAPAAPSVAANQLWSGTSSNTLGPAMIVLSAKSGRVKLRLVQFIMACTDTTDGTESDLAFDYVTGSATLNRNRFRMNLAGSSNGRDGLARITGVLGSNGRGTAVIEATAVGVDSGSNTAVERCQAGLTFPLLRGDLQPRVTP